ncbi:L-histidine N(alpha)-methyltransferase [Octadecabacter sp.]|nr:L-histidine N(alpha)-methyltransferase [Octadecabacter sp.]
MNVPAFAPVAPLSPSSSALLSDALAGLTAPQKSIDPKWLYDSVGSSLFEDITALPEYYLTRTETGILRDNAAHLAGLVPAGGALVEYGSGASVKTRVLLDHGRHMGTYVPIDISADFLQATATDLRRRYPDLTIAPVVGDFLHPANLPDGLSATPKVGFFPGSTLGNIPPEAAQLLLSRARNWDGVEAFILGIDLVKDEDTLVQAYDDSAGVTAKFIGNILGRLNTELGATFDVSAFDYRAIWNADLARIEMALFSTKQQSATLGGQMISFDAGERVSVSMSRKYTEDSLGRLARASGWRVGNWITDADNLFAVAVLRPD